MDFLKSFFRQETPASDKSMPEYYRRALFAGEVILCAYFLISVVLFAWISGRWLWQPTAVFIACIGCALNVDRFSARVNLRLNATLVALWCAWYIHRYGWSCGSQHIIPPLLALAFFNVYERPRDKIIWLCLLIAYRVALFVYSLNHAPVSALGDTAQVVLQVYNSVTPMLVLAVYYILFSSSIQESERSLILNNQELHREAGTDALTQLPNRRSMLDTVDAFLKTSPDQPFCLAIADIDFFKHVNDTYGHQCGDYTLRELSRLFLENAGEKYTVCRWGGEEFCFFLPFMNLDAAGIVMQDLNIAVRRMPLHFGDVDFSITITIGVEEYDFNSSAADVLDRADRKLYMGKVGGRDQVVL